MLNTNLTNKQFYPDYSDVEDLGIVSNATVTFSAGDNAYTVYVVITKSAVHAYYSNIKVNGVTIATVNAKDTAPIVIPITVSNGDVLTIVHEQNINLSVSGKFIRLK